LIFGLLVLLLPAAGPAAALTVGDTVTGQLSIAQKQVPLPRGAWLVAGMGTQEIAGPEVGAFGAIENIILFRRDGTLVVAVVEVNANSIPVDDGWGLTPSCERSTQFLLLTRYRTGWDLSCMFVEPTYAPMGGPGPTAWREALRAAALVGLDVPELWLSAGFRVSDRQDVIDIRYHFAPSLLIDTLAVAPNGRPDWAPTSVGADPRRLAAVRLLASWTVGSDEWIERGLRNQPAGAPLEMPRQAAFFSNTPQVDAKLRSLEQLYAAGAMPADAFLAQQQAALDEVPVLKEDRDVLGRSIQKSISYRLVSSAIDYGLAFAVAVSAPVSGWLATPVALAYSSIFVLNDLLWERHWVDQAPRDAARIVDFVHLGAPA
jgi:hypothetical protein